MGYYKNGYAHGTFWAAMIGGKPQGHLHGTIHSADGTISGNSIAYIYPDMETTFLGRSEDREMKDAQESAVLDVKCDKNGLLYVSKYACPIIDSPHFYYEPPSNVSFGAGPPSVRDPYEQKWLELKMSINEGAGEGLFSKRELAVGEAASIYSGYVYTETEHEYYSESCTLNTTKTHNERRHCAKYSIPLKYKNGTINIPPELDEPGMFIPSLGPKVQLNMQLHTSSYANNLKSCFKIYTIDIFCTTYLS